MFRCGDCEKFNTPECPKEGEVEMSDEAGDCEELDTGMW